MSNISKFYKYFIFIYFLFFSATFMILVPPFEAPDENLHLDYINFISEFTKLPNQYQQFKTDKFVGQGHQHPLYYIVLGTFNYFLNSDSRIDYKTIPNKKHIWNNGATGFVPLYNHLKGSFFATENDLVNFYVFRTVSIIFSLINLFFVFKISKLIFNDSFTQLVPVVFAAMLPQFAFISSMINNDNLSNMFATISIFYIFKILSEPIYLKNYYLLGFTYGLGIITKKTLLFLIPGIIVLIVLILQNNKNNYMKIILNFTILFGIIALISSWLFIRNYILYGDFLGHQMEIDTMQQLVDKKSIFSSYFLKDFPVSLFVSFIGVFGWMNLALPRIVAKYYLVLFLVSGVGIVYNFILNKFKDIRILTAIFLILFCLGGIVYFNLTFTQYQGRYMFPVLSLIAILFSFGLQNMISRLKLLRYRHLIMNLIFILFIITDLFSIFIVYNFYFDPLNYF